MNESDSELIRSMLKREGFVLRNRERADVVLVNHMRHSGERA